MAAEESVENSAKALVTMKEGKGNSFSTPPRRGNPERIRKKNQKYFNEEEDTNFSPVKSSEKSNRQQSTGASRIRKRTSKVYSEEDDKLYSPSKSPRKSKSSYSVPSYARSSLSTMDKRLAQSVGVRLRNLLKLPKAHKWVCYEWFYSNIDAPLFLGQNDFSICVKESFPQLKCRKLLRVEWCKIRRLMGKPRRCSPAFFIEERATLDEKREKIRLLQQRKLQEFQNLKDLPEEIPLHLVIGTKITARLRKPQDGLFTGTIEALDTVDSSYRVIFDRPGLGTHSIPDYEVLSTEESETIPLSSFQKKSRPRPGVFSPPRFIPGLSSPSQHLNDDPLLSGSPFKGRLMSLEGGTYGGFPIKFLVLVTRLSKILAIKKDWIRQLKEMNTQAEKSRSYQQPLCVEFQKKYAHIVLELDKLNKDLNDYLVGVQQYCQEIAPDHGLMPVDQPSEIRKKCEEEAQVMVSRICQAMFYNKKTAKNERILSLVGSLTSLMLQVRTFSEHDFNSFEFKSLTDSLSDIRETLDGNSINSFQNNVEIHINHIESGLSQMGNLHAFASSLTS
ncbi:protein lin-9 homolog isoform X2 [Gigantopelta aegis]|uniref:protein lin-9 homolog isoform X2 n=1 Tax=Gigantopelta aegis TaxID=1735272 RepID=UPI001B88E714|nr:protein lin-9 homolog isoform X2 [Gigantopelta aegis]